MTNVDDRGLSPQARLIFTRFTAALASYELAVRELEFARLSVGETELQPQNTAVEEARKTIVREAIALAQTPVDIRTLRK